MKLSLGRIYFNATALIVVSVIAMGLFGMKEGHSYGAASIDLATLADSLPK